MPAQQYSAIPVIRVTTFYTGAGPDDIEKSITQPIERAVAASPDFVEARLNLGIALQQSGQPARAAEAYRAVLRAGGHPRERQAAQKLLKAMGAQ